MKQAELKTLIESESKEVRPLIHPTMALRYRKAVMGLKAALKGGKNPEAKEHVRALIEKIVITPKEGRKELSIDLYGDLAGILKIATEGELMNTASALTKRLEKKVANGNFLSEPSITMVAGAGFEPTTFGL